MTEQTPKIVFLDAESYYDQEYSLRKMTPAEYIMDDRFECFGWAVAEDGGETRWMRPDEFKAWLAKLPPRVIFVSHNALFDMFILAHRFGYVPHMMLCTLSMARATVYAETGSVSLAAVTKHLKLGAKTDTILKVQGKRWEDIKAEGLALEFITYATNDTNKCRLIFHELLNRGFPPSEFRVMDLVIRACVAPQMEYDEDLLEEHYEDVISAKQALMDKAGVEDPKQLRSDEFFASLLRNLGVDPPRKISLTTGQEKYAFAKTDSEFLDLEEHENPDVQALISARIGVKTTLEESRTQRFIALSKLTYPTIKHLSSPAPFPLRYSGAHTHRLSGDWKLNKQNLRKDGKLRRALKAPDGTLLATADESQVEARLVAWFCGQRDLVEQFANGEDVYSTFATSVYGYPCSKATRPERFIGKTSILGLGFGMGADKFNSTVEVQSRLQHINVEMDVNEAQRVVTLYRTNYPYIPAMWRFLNDTVIPILASGGKIAFGPNGVICAEDHTLILPNDMRLYYHDLQNKDGDWWFKYGKRQKKLFGGKLLENIIQALARIIVMDAGVRIRQKTGLAWCLQVHDELGYIVPAPSAGKFAKYLEKELVVPPVWGPGIPLAAESAVGANFADAK